MLTENKNKKPKKKKIRNYSKQNEETDLKKEIDFLLAKKENVICNDDDDNDDIVHIRKNIDFRDDSKGKPYNFKLRNLYYILEEEI